MHRLLTLSLMRLGGVCQLAVMLAIVLDYPSPGACVAGSDEGPFDIALLVPSTTRKTQISQTSQLPVMTLFAPSLKETIMKDDPKYKYHIYLGYDEGDPFYDQGDNVKKTEDEILRVLAGYSVVVKPVRFTGKQNVCSVWNGLFRKAYEDGCDYFYQLNDDVRFLTPGWTDRFVTTFLESHVKKNFGIAGPLDKNNVSIMTQSMVGRPHYTIFENYYPPVFKNWYSDDWGSKVYGPKNSFWLKDVHVRNSQPQGTRYEIDWKGGEVLQEEIQKGRRKILRYLLTSGGEDD